MDIIIRASSNKYGIVHRWVCTSADPNDLDKTDEIATTVLEDIINKGGRNV